MKRMYILVISLFLLMGTLLVFTGCKEEEKAAKAEEEVEVEKEEARPEIKNPDSFIYASYGTIDTLDPAKAYDSASWQNMHLLYDTLVSYKGEATDEFVPFIASELPTVENGGITNGGKTYTFKIREGVKFHSGDTVTPEDVEYSFERNMVLDPAGGPNWIWFQLFTGDRYSSRGGDGNFQVTFDEIDAAVEVDGNTVVFNLANPFPAFMSVLAGQWAIILNKSFCVENGDWPGTADTWKEYNNPAEDKEALHEIEDGAGPYKLTRWEKGVEMVHERFEDYWGEKPPIKKVYNKIVDEWSTRKLMLLQGDADCVQVDSLYYEEMEKEENLKIYKDQPTLVIGGVYFNRDIAAVDNPLIGSGKLDGEGIPADFFADKNVRFGFIHAWDEEVFLEDIGAGAYTDPVTPFPIGLPYRDESIERHVHDMEKAEEYFKKAFGGKVWENGFKVDILYNEGNDVRRGCAMLLAENVMKLNPKFEINVRAVEWSEYVDMIRKSNMPIFYCGWAPDYADPDNYANPFMHSTGHWAGQCGYSNPEVDKLIEEAATSLDPELRRKNYYRLQELWQEDPVGIIYGQALDRYFFRDWMKGYFFNPMYGHPEFENVRFGYKKEY
jgi:peptide/nickel transport system substrate-binding protein